MPENAKRSKWVLVPMDHFTRWQDVIAVPDATAPVVAATLDEKVFCYLGLVKPPFVIIVIITPNVIIVNPICNNNAICNNR